MWVPVAVRQPCELLYTCYLLVTKHSTPQYRQTAMRTPRHSIFVGRMLAQPTVSMYWRQHTISEVSEMKFAVMKEYCLSDPHCMFIIAKLHIHVWQSDVEKNFQASDCNSVSLDYVRTICIPYPTLAPKLLNQISLIQVTQNCLIQPVKIT